MEARGTATGTQTTPETETPAQATETPKAGGTPGERLEIGRTEGGTTAAMAGAPTTAIRTPEAVWKAHLGPAPPWKAYIEKTRHDDMERLKTAMHGELEAFSHQAGNFITRSHSEFIRQQEEKYAARAETPPTEVSSAWAI